MTHQRASLSRYAVDATTGFVPAVPPLARLPQGFTPWEDLVPRISALIRARRIRAAIQALPTLEARELHTSAQQERALLILSVLINAWVWGDEQPHLRIPGQLAVPACAVARELGRPPITHYASMALNNWELIDPRQPLSANNARMQVQFLGGVDEDWFFMACIEVELAGAPLLGLVLPGVSTAEEGSDTELTNILEEMAAGMKGVHQALGCVRNWCDPHTYYLRVRPFLSGWPDPGVVYEGDSDEPRRYVGGSAGQSSLIQVLDALLGIDHGDTAGGRYLRSIRAYMPIPHRAFVHDIERWSRVRVRSQRGSPGLRAAYNAAVDQIDVFRKLHAELARDYIGVPSGAKPDDIGTGGTTFASFLQNVRLSTSGSRL